MDKQNFYCKRILPLMVGSVLILTPTALAQETHALSFSNEIANNNSSTRWTRERFLQADVLSNSSEKEYFLKVFNVKGEARLLRKGEQNWQDIHKDDALKMGDQIMTGRNSYVDLAHDQNYLNITRIKAETKAELRNTKPFELYLEDGSLFGALDGIVAMDGTYQVSTPTAVIAVRGTHLSVNFVASNDFFSAATLPVPRDQHQSSIFIQDILPNGEMSSGINLWEGQEMNVSHNDLIEQTMPQTVHPWKVNQAAEIWLDISQSVENFEDLRQQGFEEIGSQAEDEKQNDDDNENKKPADDGLPPADQSNLSNAAPIDSNNNQFRQIDASALKAPETVVPIPGQHPLTPDEVMRKLSRLSDAELEALEKDPQALNAYLNQPDMPGESNDNTEELQEAINQGVSEALLEEAMSEI